MDTVCLGRLVCQAKAAQEQLVKTAKFEAFGYLDDRLRILDCLTIHILPQFTTLSYLNLQYQSSGYILIPCMNKLSDAMFEKLLLLKMNGS